VVGGRSRIIKDLPLRTSERADGIGGGDGGGTFEQQLVRRQMEKGETGETGETRQIK